MKMLKVKIKLSIAVNRIDHKDKDYPSKKQHLYRKY
jgi:hypothetical protein